MVVGAFAFLQVREERARLVRDLERRANLLAEGLKEAVGPVMGGRSTAPIERILKRFGRPNQVIVVYDSLASPIAVMPESASTQIPSMPEITEAFSTDTARKGFQRMGERRVYVYATPLTRSDRPIGVLAVFLDASHLAEAETSLWQHNAIRFVVLALVLSGITVLLVQIIRRAADGPDGGVDQVAQDRPRRSSAPGGRRRAYSGPWPFEVSGLARRLYRAEEAAEQEAALRLRGETVWTEERLKQFVNLQVGGPIFVVSNREPVSHVSKDGKVVAQTPASGLVTAMEPVLRACGGVWVAHGSGDCRPRDLGRAGTARCSRGRSALHPAPRVAHAGRGVRLLLQLLE